MPEHDHPALAINRSLHRLPLILDILDEIEASTCYPGDDDLRRGSHQAVRQMVTRLQNIEPSNGTTLAAPNHELEIASTWLLGERPRKLLPPSLFRELSGLIEKLIPASAGLAGGQSGNLT